MTPFLIAQTGPNGGVSVIDGDGVEQIERVEHTSFVARDGEAIIALAGSDQGRVIVTHRDGSQSWWPTGEEPCHAALSPAGDLLVVTDYTSGTLSVLERTGEGRFQNPRQLKLTGAGSLVDPDRQDAPHPHHALWHGEHLLVTDLGCDLIRVFTATGGELVEVSRCPTPPGSGPRHSIVVGSHLVVTAELSASVVAAPLADVMSGSASWEQVPATRATSEARCYPSELVVWGASVAVANRGSGTIALIDAREGRLSLEREWDAGGPWPQHLLVDGDGLLIAQRDSHAIVRLSPDGSISIVAQLDAPSWLAPA